MIGLLRSCERYDPDRDVWEPICAMQTTRCYFGAAVVGGRLFAVGGVDGRMGFLSSVEVYDPETDSWAYVQDMSTKRPAAVTADYSQSQEDAQPASLVVGGLPVSLDSCAVRDLCSKFGDVVSCRVCTDASGRSVGEAVVTFRERRALEEAMQLDQLSVEGSRITCEICEPSTPARTGLAAAPVTWGQVARAAAGLPGPRTVNSGSRPAQRPGVPQPKVQPASCPPDTALQAAGIRVLEGKKIRSSTAADAPTGRPARSSLRSLLDDGKRSR